MFYLQNFSQIQICSIARQLPSIQKQSEIIPDFYLSQKHGIIGLSSKKKKSGEERERKKRVFKKPSSEAWKMVIYSKNFQLPTL